MRWGLTSVSTAEISGRRRFTWAWVLSGLVLVLAAVCALAWVFRIAIATAVVERNCAERAIVCTFEITELTLHGAVVEDVSVAMEPGPAPLGATRLDIELKWEELRPEAVSLYAEKPRIAASFDGERFSFGGFESLLESGPGKPGQTLPRIVAEDGRIELSTPAGSLAGAFQLDLKNRQDARLRARIEPARLETQAGQFDLGSAELDLSLVDGEPTGVADLEISEAAFGRFGADSVLLRAETLAASQDGQQTIAFRLAARELSSRTLTLRAATSDGQLILATEELTGTALPQAVRSATLRFSADTMAAPDFSAEGLDIDLAVDRSEGGELIGPMALTAGAAALDGLFSTGPMAVTGDVSATRRAFDGQVTAQAVAVSSAQLDRLESLLAWPAPLDGHGEALREAFAEALTDFDTGARLSVALDDGRALRLSARGATRLAATNGLQASISSFGETPWLDYAAGDATLRGVLGLKGGGGPTFAALLDELSIEGGLLTLKLREADLADWRVGETLIGGGFTRVDVNRSPERLATGGQGAVRFDGSVGGLDVLGLNLFGAIDTVRGSEGWRAQLGGGRCLSLAVGGLAAQSFKLGGFTTSLCPQDGRLVRQAGERSSGALDLDAISVPFAVGAARGDLRLPASRLDWTLGEGVSARLNLPGLAMDMVTGPRELELSTGSGEVGFDLAPGRVESRGRLRSVEFGGSLIPANALAERFDFRLQGTPNGLAGTADLAGVGISDYRADPLYQPVRADLSAELLRGDVRLIGPVFLEATGRHIADAEIEVTFPAVDGMITVTGRDLEFAPGGLQPTDLSERLRGYFTDTRGQLDAEARIAIDRGNLGGTADMTARDFSFQTLALGRVDGVDGGVFFSDLLKLESPPGQTFQIASIDPGLPLSDGEIRFQMTGGGSAALESALWPFAGGVLAVEPTRWDIGAQRRRLTVRADRIALGDLSELLQLPGFDAEGNVSGRFPIVFEPGAVRIENARLVADRNGGILRYSGDVGAEAGATNESVATAFAALENFEFTVLEIGANGDLLDDVVLTARLEGRNPDVLGGSPFNFNVSLDSKLGQLLNSARDFSGTDWLAQVQARQVEDSPG